MNTTLPEPPLIQNQEEIEIHLSDLTKTLSELDESISAIEGQLETRPEADWQWRGSALRALKHYNRKRQSIQGIIKAARVQLNEIGILTIQAAKAEQRLTKAENHAKTVALAEKNLEAKQQRIALSQNENQLFLNTIKQILEERYGREVYLDIVNSTKQRMTQI